ncbi:MAG: DUF4430 domain-containing protein [Thermoleophilia bacterium]|nr:DUF4430 domain-containing protein [Thermoleophilia bacterium]
MLVAVVMVFSGCGLGAGSQEGTAELLVTRDHGSEVLADKTLDDLTESENAIRVLDDNAEVETRYGGGFVQSVDGLEGGTPGGRSFDWFFSVNGIVSEVGGAEFPVNAGDQVWWDYRDWTDAMEIGAVVGAFPAPMAGGYDGKEWPVSIECLDSAKACKRVRDQLGEAGVDAEISVKGLAPSDDTLRFVVGTWDRVNADPAAGRLASGPASSGIFARFKLSNGTNTLVGLDQEGDQAGQFGPDAGLVAASRRGEGAPVWFVTGGTEAGVEAAASALTQTDLEHRYAAAVTDDRVTSLPLP